MSNLARFNVMLDRDDVATIDKHFPNQRSDVIRGLIRRFVLDKLSKRTPPKEPTDD